MRALVEYFLKRTLVVNIILFGIFVVAGVSLKNTNRNQYPEVDLGLMVINTEYPGASPRDVEQNVTRLIEEQLKGIPGLYNFESVSAENFSSIVVEIDMDYPDKDEVKDNIRNAVDRVSELPAEVTKKPVVRDLKSSEFPVLVVGISGDVDYSILRQTAKIVERDIRRIRGISNIDKYGYRDLEYQVDLDPDKLKNYYIALNDVLFSLSSRNVRSTGGSLESYRTQRNILTLSQFDDIDDVRNVIVRSTFEGGDVKVKDLGTVNERFKDEKMRTIFNGKRGISLVIKKSQNADIINVVDKLTDYIKEKNKIVPEGVSLTAVNDASFIVRNRLSVVTSNAIIGFILVVGILIIFLDMRSSILIALSIPTSFALTFAFMPFFDVDLNAITLAALIISLGMIVDQSIVVSENSIYYLNRRYPKLDSIQRGTLEVVMPVTASVLTTILAFAPMFAMSGMIGKFVYVIPMVIILSLVGSLLNSYFILPNHLAHSISEKSHIPADIEEEHHHKSWQDRFFDNVAIPYSRVLPVVLKRRYTSIGLAMGILSVTIWFGFQNIPFNIFPSDGADTFYIYVELPDESTFDATEEVIKQIEEIIGEIPKDELEYYTAKLGTTESLALATPLGGDEYLAYMEVTLVPHSNRSRDAQVIMEEVRKKTLERIKSAKEIRFELKKPGPPAGTPIEFHVHSDDDKLRNLFVEKLVDDLKQTRGVYDVTTDTKLGREEYKLDLNYNLLARALLTVQDVASTLRIAFDGVVSTSIVKKNEEIDIRVRFPKEHRQDVRNVLNLDIRNYEHRLIPIKSFAKLSHIRAETAIHHTDGDVTTTIFGQTDFHTTPKKVIDDLNRKFSPELVNYPEVSFSYGGEAEKSAESMQSLGDAFLVGVIAIYLILILLFQSLTQPMIVLLAIPFGIIGVIWAFYFHGRPFSFLGVIGVIGLSGIVVNNSLMMVEFINKLTQERMKTGLSNSVELIDDIVAGSVRRLRPIVITTLTTVTGLLPTAYGIGGSDPLIEPMVLAIAWGLIFSTQISLLLIPAFYMANLDLVFLIKRMKNYIMGILSVRS